MKRTQIKSVSTAKCQECDWEYNSSQGVKQIARLHAQQAKHLVRVDVVEIITFDGNG